MYSTLASKSAARETNAGSFDSDAHLPLRGMMLRVLAQDDARLECAHLPLRGVMLRVLAQGDARLEYAHLPLRGMLLFLVAQDDA